MLFGRQNTEFLSRLEMLRWVPGICEHGDGKELDLRPVDQYHLVWQQKQQDPTAMLSGFAAADVQLRHPCYTGWCNGGLAAVSREVLLPHSKYCEQTAISSTSSAV